MADCTAVMAVTEMKSHVIHRADYRRERWRNGLG